MISCGTLPAHSQLCSRQQPLQAQRSTAPLASAWRGQVVAGFSNTAFASGACLASFRQESDAIQGCLTLSKLAGTSLRRCSAPRTVATRASLSVEANLFGRFFRVVRSYANSFGKPTDLCIDISGLQASTCTHAAKFIRKFLHGARLVF